MVDMTVPNSKLLLDREGVDSFVKQHLKPSVDLLRELVDYGVTLITRCAQTGGSLSDLIITAHFFKHVVSMLDSVEVQLSRGAVFASGVSARSMLEAYIYIAWILQEDSERRGRQFYIWHLRQKRAWARRVVPGTPEYTRYEQHINMLADYQEPTRRKALEDIGRRQEAEIDKILNNDNNIATNAIFDNMKTRHFGCAVVSS